MRRRETVRGVGTLARGVVFAWVVAAAAGTEASGAEPDEGDRPNIVFLLADDLGWADINSFDPLDRGYYETPRIDALASQGIRFTQAYANAANCAPTRAALLSGQYYPNQPIYHVGSPSKGKLIPAENARHLPLEKVTLAEALKDAGYTTGFIGKWHIGDPPKTGPTAQGFDLNVGGYIAGNPNHWEGEYRAPNNNPYIQGAKKGEYLTDYLSRRAVRFIEDHADEPFYLQLSYYTPHAPLQAPKELVRKYRKKEGAGGHDHPVYAAMIEQMDRNVGKVMDALDRLGLAEETIVVFFSDNGGRGGYGFLGHPGANVTSNAPLKSGKGSFYEGGIRVPLIVRWPDVVEAGVVSEEPVIGTDLYPTFLDAAGVEEPDGHALDGVSLMPILRNADASLDRDALYWHFPGYPNAKWRTSPVSVIRSGRWKLMKFYEGPTLELYDLARDVGEENNLAEERPEKRRALHQKLQAWLEKTDAPMPKRK